MFCGLTESVNPQNTTNILSNMQTNYTFLRVFCSMNAKSKLKEVKEYPKKLRTASLQPSRINQSVWCSSPLHSDLQSRYSAVQHTCHVFVVGFNEHERSCWYSDSERSSAHANNAFLSAELKPV